MIDYISGLVVQSELDYMSVTITKECLTVYANKNDHEVAHKYPLSIINTLYCKEYALKSELAQMVIDVCSAASEGEKHGSNY